MQTGSARPKARVSILRAGMQVNPTPPNPPRIGELFGRTDKTSSQFFSKPYVERELQIFMSRGFISTAFVE